MSNSYSSGVSDVPLLGETIGDALVEVTNSRRWSCRAFAADVDALSLGLLAAAIAKGDHVGTWAPKCAGWVLL